MAMSVDENDTNEQLRIELMRSEIDNNRADRTHLATT